MKNKKDKPSSTVQQVRENESEEFFSHTGYIDSELHFFREMIVEKLTEAKNDYNLLVATLNRHNKKSTGHCPTFKFSEDATDIYTKDQIALHTVALNQYIEQLEYALRRIKNKMYGTCCITGKLIPKERLFCFPGTTMSEETRKEIARVLNLCS